VNKLVCASNENNVLYDFLTTGIYDRNREFLKTISPSMDILISSNLERLLYDLSGSDDKYIKSLMEDLKKNGKYTMWFSSRGEKTMPTYRIRKAISMDGIKWERIKEIELDVSESGWDSEMVCYPYVFEYNDKLYMLYNGNGYGKTGIGLAILEEE